MLVGTVRSNVPVRSGRLKKAVKAYNLKKRYLRPGEFGRTVKIYRGKSRNDPKGAYYGHFVNSGYIRGGSYHAGVRFMERGYQQGKTTAAREATAKMGQELDKELRANK